MQKEGKMLINKEQNQVYVIPEKKIPYLKDNSSLPFSIFKSMLPQRFFQNEQLFSFIEQNVSSFVLRMPYLCIKLIH